MNSDMEDVKRYADKLLAYLIDIGEPVSYDELQEKVFEGDYQLAVDTQMWALETGLVDNVSVPKDPNDDPKSCMRYMVPTDEGKAWHGAFNFPYVISRYNEKETVWEYLCEITDEMCIHEGRLHCDQCDVPKR